ncbi:MAG TPA: site-specific integrase [Terriglobales bacterium]|jgi:integrase
MSEQILSLDSIMNEPAAEARFTAPALQVVQKEVSGFTKAKDSRGRQIEGLWQRNGRFYCQLSVPGKGCRRLPLRDENNQPIATVTVAIEAMHELRRKKRQSELPNCGRAPQFPDYVKHYLSFIEKTNKKKLKTIVLERCVLKAWTKFLGNIRLSQITRNHLNLYVAQRKQSGVCNRTANYDVIALSNCLKFAKEEGWLNGKLPTEGYKRLKYVAPKRPLFTKEQFEKVCQVATKKNADGTPKYRSGELLADLIRFMRTTGARVTSALSTRWSDVDWVRRQVHLRNTKYDKQNIVVDFNDELEAVLKEMHTRRLPDSDCLFPGTRTAGNVGSLRGTFETVREEAGLPNLHFHDARHHFISECVMCGVDFMTIAKWCGHSDGGMLIGKVYGHLSNEHAQWAASKVKFGNGRNEPEVRTTMANAHDMSVQELLQIVQQKMQ